MILGAVLAMLAVGLILLGYCLVSPDPVAEPRILPGTIGAALIMLAVAVAAIVPYYTKGG